MVDRLFFVQLSDLHFGPDRETRQWDRIRGYQPHDLTLAMALPGSIEQALADAGADDEDSANILVSGDLTLAGRPAEFATAEEYLSRQVPLHEDLSPESWGLGSVGDARVPGNHDHWDGRMLRSKRWVLQRAYNPDLFPHPQRASSWPPPFVEHPWPKVFSAGGLQVQVFGIDSQSGFAANTTNLRARGSISLEQVQLFEKHVAASTAGEHGAAVVRVAMLHHPLASGWLATHVIDPQSRSELLTRLADGEFAIVLAGHMHSFLPHWIPATKSNGTQRAVLEIRAPSTMQGRARDAHHGFLLHVVERSQDGVAESVSWRCLPYLWSEDKSTFALSSEEVCEVDLLEFSASGTG